MPTASPLHVGRYWGVPPTQDPDPCGRAMRRLPPPLRGGRLAAPWRATERPQAAAGRPPVAQAFATAQLRVAADSLTAALAGDASAYAIPRHKLDLVDEIALDVYGLAADGRPVGTCRQQRSNWKHWVAWCAHLGISPHRHDARANAGLDPVGAHREAFILAGGLRFIYNTPLSHKVGHFLVRYQGEEMSLRGPQNLKARGRFTLDEL